MWFSFTASARLLKFCKSEKCTSIEQTRKKLSVLLPDCSDEEHWLLGDDCQLAPQVVQTNLWDIDPVNDNGASRELHQSEQSYTQRGLSCRKKMCVHVERGCWCMLKLLQVRRTESVNYLPDPVRPTMPMVSPGRMVKDRFLSTSGRPSR